MRFWLRELLGWLFLLLGLALFGLCVVFINARWVVEGSIAAFVGLMIFRAGVHFLKVAVAARIYFNTRSPASSGQEPVASTASPRKGRAA